MDRGSGLVQQPEPLLQGESVPEEPVLGADGAEGDPSLVLLDIKNGAVEVEVEVEVDVGEAEKLDPIHHHADSRDNDNSRCLRRNLDKYRTILYQKGVRGKNKKTRAENMDPQATAAG